MARCQAGTFTALGFRPSVLALATGDPIPIDALTNTDAAAKVVIPRSTEVADFTLHSLIMRKKPMRA
jgi:hypothetical protein